MRPRALDELCEDYGWRVFDNDLIEPTLAERPAPSCRRSGPRWRVDRERHRPTGAALARSASSVPEADRDRFDELVADARAAYGANDDNTTVLFALPLGLVRRAALEVGRRLVAQGRADEPDHVLDAERAELAELLRGGGPSRGELADRAAARIRARAVVPPPVIGSPSAPVAPPALGPNTVALVADARRVPPGRLAREGTTRRVPWPRSATASFGGGRWSPPIPPMRSCGSSPVTCSWSSRPRRRTTRSSPRSAAVAVQHGGLMSHAAVLARELGLAGADRGPGPDGPGARRRSGGGRPRRRDHHGGQRLSHLRATPA